MTVSRREFTLTATTLLGTASVAGSHPAQAPAPNVESTLEGQAGSAIFEDESWLELLRRAVELNAETRALLRDYELSSDAEPAITFVRY